MWCEDEQNNSKSNKNESHHRHRASCTHMHMHHLPHHNMQLNDITNTVGWFISYTYAWCHSFSLLFIVFVTAVNDILCVYMCMSYHLFVPFVDVDGVVVSQCVVVICLVMILVLVSLACIFLLLCAYAPILLSCLFFVCCCCPFLPLAFSFLHSPILFFFPTCSLYSCYSYLLLQSEQSLNNLHS